MEDGVTDPEWVIEVLLWDWEPEYVTRQELAKDIVLSLRSQGHLA